MDRGEANDSPSVEEQEATKAKQSPVKVLPLKNISGQSEMAEGDILKYRKPTKESLQTAEYTTAATAHNVALQELDSVSIHRGLDDIERPIFSRSTSSTLSRLFGRNKQDVEGRLLGPDDGDDADLSVSFSNYSDSKKREHLQMTPL
ncbi:Copper-transporting ATPase 1 [Gryllus bimaculatus]|nr:Copper-transporting ATPase 1 [Gryllus bimaculatus]